MKQYVDHVMKTNTSAMKTKIEENTAAIEATNARLAKIEENTAAIEAMLSALVNK